MGLGKFSVKGTQDVGFLIEKGRRPAEKTLLETCHGQVFSMTGGKFDHFGVRIQPN
mgnify:CR=1 FL=1